MRSVAGIAVFALLGACGDDSSAGPFADAGMDAETETDAEPLPVFDCWPDIAPIERGTVTLGAGGAAYSEMPETLPLEYGAQGGFMVKVWTKMTGFIPGALPIVNTRNPFTRVRATFTDSSAALQPAGECGSREWYVPSPTGGYELNHELAVAFDTCWKVDRLIGARMQIDVELMDATGSYATDSRTITATVPVTEYPDGGPTDPSCGT